MRGRRGYVVLYRLGGEGEMVGDGGATTTIGGLKSVAHGDFG